MIKKIALIITLITCYTPIIPASIDDLLEQGRKAIDAKNKELAYQIFKSILAQEPNNIHALFHLGTVYYYDNDTAHAIPYLKKAFSLNPQNLTIAKNLSIILNAHGEFNNALSIFEILHDRDRKDEVIATRLLPLYLRNMDWYYALKLCSVDDLWWYNESIKGQNVLLDLSSQWNGLGDIFQIVRYAKHLAHAGALVTVKTRAELMPILSLCPFITSIITTKQPTPSYDKTYTLLTDRCILRMRDTLYSPSKDVPYLFADQSKIAFWKNQLKADTHYKVGLCWQSTKMRDFFSGAILPGPRAISLEKLSSLLKIKNVSFYSLQHGEDAQIAQLNSQGFKLKSFKNLDADGAFMDTAAIMKNLDLVITVDTSIAHLAGGLGVPVWVMLPYAGEWRWFAQRNDSPLYPTMKLFRQTDNGNWQSVVNAIEQKLKAIV